MALATGIIAYYKLENTTDSVGGFTLTNNGTASFVAAKHLNGADLGTANTTKYFSVVSNLGLTGTGSMAISFWIKINTEITSNIYALIDHRTTSTADRYLVLSYDYNGGTRRLRLNTSNTFIDYTVTLGTANYYHIVINRTTTTLAEVFVNGVSVSSGTPGTLTDGNNKFSIGNDIAGSATSFANAILDEVGVWSRPLTQAEITQIYNAGTGFFYPFIETSTTNTVTSTETVTAAKKKIISQSDTETTTDATSPTATTTPGTNIWSNTQKTTAPTITNTQKT